MSTVTITPTGTWRLDPVHSTVGFEIAYLGGTFKGHFRDVEAKLAVDGERARVAGAAQVASVDVKDENLAAHLQSPDFFDSERYPALRFAADELRIDDEKVSGTGELMIKGVTQPVAVAGAMIAPITDAYGRERIGVRLSAAVDRTDFGVSWNNPLPNGEPALANEVTILAELYFIKATA